MESEDKRGYCRVRYMKVWGAYYDPDLTSPRPFAVRTTKYLKGIHSLNPFNRALGLMQRFEASKKTDHWAYKWAQKIAVREFSEPSHSTWSERHGQDIHSRGRARAAV